MLEYQQTQIGLKVLEISKDLDEFERKLTSEKQKIEAKIKEQDKGLFRLSLQ
jgi:hypothetical protein